MNTRLLSRGLNIQLFAEGDKTFTQEEVDKMINDRLARERERNLILRKKNLKESIMKVLKSMRRE